MTGWSLMKLLSEAFDTVKRVYAYEKSVKADTATLQKIMAVFAIVIFYGELKMIESKQIKGFLKKLDELYGKKEVIAPIVFRDADILIQNPLSGGKNAVRYEVMDTLIETEHYFLLFTKEWQITIIAKDGMDSGEKDRFLKMMEEKMPGLKRKYGKK